MKVMEKKYYSELQNELLKKYSKATTTEEKEKILDEYLQNVREQLVVLSAKYDERFIMNVINGITSDNSTITIQGKDHQVKEIIDNHMNNKTFVASFLLPYIRTYKHYFERIDTLYKEEYETDGKEGVEYISILLPEIVEQAQVAGNMPNENISYQTSVIKRMLAFKHNLYSNSEEIDEYKNFDLELSKDFAKQKEKAKKEWKYFVLGK